MDELIVEAVTTAPWLVVSLYGMNLMYKLCDKHLTASAENLEKVANSIDGLKAALYQKGLMQERRD